VSWQRTAQAAAIAAHRGELILRTLSEPSAQLTTTPAATAALRQAADATCQAQAAWRAVAHAWDTFTTGPGAQLTLVAGEISDLVLWAGRLAYQNPAWTPARGQASPRRTAVDFSEKPGGITGALAAVSDISGVLAQIAAHDRESVRAAAAKDALFVPTRLLPGGHDLPYRYVPALPAMTDTLLATYDATIRAATRAAAALSNLQPIPDHRTTALAALRATLLDAPRLHHAQAVVIAPPATQPAPGRVEQALRSRRISEPALLARAAALDDATQKLISAATAKSQRQNEARRRARQRAEDVRANRQHPAGLAAKDSPPTTSSRTPLPRLVPISHQIRHGPLPNNGQRYRPR
jgi:hypothetical protein